MSENKKKILEMLAQNKIVNRQQKWHRIKI